jgi:hypothetical protein
MYKVFITAVPCEVMSVIFHCEQISYIVHHVRKPTNFLFNVLSGGCCSEYLATAAFVEQADNLFDTG